MPLIAEVPIRSRVTPCEVYGAEGGNGKGFPPSTFHHCSVIIFNLMLLLYHKNRHSECNMDLKQCLFGHLGALDKKKSLYNFIVQWAIRFRTAHTSSVHIPTDNFIF